MVGLALEDRMANTMVEVGRIEVNGSTVYSVRVVESGVLTVKAHCNSLDEAKLVAEREADRLRVSISYENGKP